MLVTQQVLHHEGETLQLSMSATHATGLLLVFGSPALFRFYHAQLISALPDALIAGCSSSGDIANDAIYDDALVLTLIEFSHSRIAQHKVLVKQADETALAAQTLAKQLSAPDLKHVLIFSEGLHVNGSTLAQMLNRFLPLGVTVTGGLAGDGARFTQTHVYDRDGAHSDHIIAIGLYGENLEVTYGSLGGWDSFGPQRKITHSIDNVLYELDGQSALSLYKMYLGEAAKELPSSGLLFPLHLQIGDDERGVVRTILSVDEAQQSMTFAGDMPVDARVRLMRANFDRLIDGATGAAQLATSAKDVAQFALLVSCVGRRLVLQQRCIEELHSVRAVVGSQTVLSGFYSYGELCPNGQSLDCSLHNQTMTITSLSER